MLGGWGCVAGCKQTSHHPCGYTQTASLFAVRSPGNPKIRIETEGQNIRLLFEPGAGRKGLWEVPACGPEIMEGEKNPKKPKKLQHKENLGPCFFNLLALQESIEDICFIFSFYSVEFP